MKNQFVRKIEKTVLLSTISFLILNLGISASLSEFDLQSQGVQNAFAGAPPQYRLFAHDNTNSQIVEIDQTTGQATVVGSTTIPSGASGLASTRIDLNLACGFFPKGTHFGILDVGVDKVVTIDTSTGKATPVSDNDVGLGGRGVAFGNGGVFYATDSTGTGQLYTVDICTGAKAALPSQIGFQGVDNIQWDPVSSTFVGISGTTLVSINPATGVGSPIAAPLSISFPSCTIARDPGTGLWYSINQGNGNLLRIDINTGMVTFVGGKNNPAVSNGLCGTAFEEVPANQIIGGEINPINSVSLLLAGAQSSAVWLLPVVLSAVGIGLVLVRRD